MKRLLPILGNHLIPEFDNADRVLGIDRNSESAVSADRSAVTVPFFCARIEQREADIRIFQLALGDQGFLAVLEIPVLVEHPDYLTACNLGQILVIVLNEGFFIHQALSVNLI
ncbi:hypothetical protein D3C75_1043660 [compost metagenome]